MFELYFMKILDEYRIMPFIGEFIGEWKYANLWYKMGMEWMQRND